MAAAEPPTPESQESDELLTLVEDALCVADGLGLSMVAIHLNQAREALRPKPRGCRDTEIQ